MSDTDSFIEEVTEEVRRDHLYGLARRYGWIVVLGVFGIVGGAAWNELRKANQAEAAANLGDGIIAALEAEDAQGRSTALAAISTENAQAKAVVAFLEATELQDQGETAAAVAVLNGLAVDAELTQIYRDLAAFKALTLQADSLPADQLRLQLDALVNAGSPFRLFATEQLALLDAKSGDTDAAIERLERIVADAETTAGLRRRASQLIVALGGDPAGS